jgi:hypothetical protein
MQRRQGFRALRTRKVTAPSDSDEVTAASHAGRGMADRGQLASLDPITTGKTFRTGTLTFSGRKQPKHVT